MEVQLQLFLTSVLGGLIGQPRLCRFTPEEEKPPALPIEQSSDGRYVGDKTTAKGVWQHRRLAVNTLQQGHQQV